MPTTKQLTDLAKLYNNKMKYSSKIYDVLDQKIQIFKHNYYKASIPPNQYPGAFSTILKDDAATYYFSHLCGKAKYTFQTLVQQIHTLFETEDNHKTYLIH